MVLKREDVEQRCRAVWGEMWRDLLMSFRGRNMFARQLLVAECATLEEVDDKIARLTTWINSPDRVRADLGAVKTGCIVENGRTTCYRGGAHGR